MRFVAVKHPQDVTGRPYLFQSPENLHIPAGTYVLCNTNKGNDQLAQCVTCAFDGDPDVMKAMWGTNKLKKITAVLKEFRVVYPDEDTKEMDT